MDFSEVSKKVFAAYGKGAYHEAIGVVSEARAHFPDRDSSLTFWEACLLSLAGEPAQALAALEAGFERGLFWDARLLADPDLDATRELERWESFEVRSGARVESQVVSRPNPLIRRTTDASGTIVALHGAGHAPADFQSEWVAAMPDDWTVVAPVGDVAVSNDGWAWPYDLSTDSLAASLGDIQLSDPVVVVGFSQGARLAAKAAWNGVIDVSGLLLFAGGLQVDTWNESEQRGAPVYIVVGTGDLAYEPCLATAAVLESDGVPVHLDVREGLGHQPPVDLAETIRTGIGWLIAQRTE